MSRKFLDLSVSLEEGIKSDPDFMLPKINYHHHKETAEEMMSFFPGLKKTDLPGEEGWAMETITVSTHNGTHMDAPYHYHSTMNNGQRAITIDEVPLEWCFSDGVKLDLRSYEDGYVLTRSDLQNEIKKINYELKPLDIVCITLPDNSTLINEELLDFELISFLLKTHFSSSLNKTNSASLPSFKRSLSNPIIFLGDTVKSLIISNKLKFSSSTSTFLTTPKQDSKPIKPHEAKSKVVSLSCEVCGA